MLHEFISFNRGEIISRCRAKVAARLIPAPTESEINHGVPLFLDQVVGALRHQETAMPQIGRSAALHGHDLLQRGFSVGQVVHDYGDVCQSITEIAVETNVPIDADDFRTLNRCLDDAIADAVTAYGSDRNDLIVRDERRETARFGFFVHELRNLLQTATFASESLLTGGVGVGGSTAGVLRRSLLGLRSLIDDSIADVRETHGIQHPEVFSVPKFVEELVDAAALDASSHNVTLEVMSSDIDAEIRADRRNLSAAINNLLQNAVKFTRPGTRVTLRTVASRGRILIEVQDECGGLPDGMSAELFHPFEQRGSNRSGLGLGLAYSQWAVIANGGRLYVRNFPGSGCVFIVDLPQHLPQPLATREQFVSVPSERRR
jgi:signal transduction histidine kinase